MSQFNGLKATALNESNSIEGAAMSGKSGRWHEASDNEVKYWREKERARLEKVARNVAAAQAAHNVARAPNSTASTNSKNKNFTNSLKGDLRSHKIYKMNMKHTRKNKNIRRR
jgi:hypothetical protein